jgi:Xaa-Pro dipeptidase
MNDPDNSALYRSHLETLQQRYDEVLAQARLDAVVIPAGTPAPIFNDDQQLPFRANPYLLQWAPLLAHPDAMLCYRRGELPQLLIYTPDDFWHLAAGIPELLQGMPIEVITVNEGMQLYDSVKNLPRKTALIGEVREQGDNFGIRKVNPQGLMDHLNYLRSFKTPWEVACIKEANEKATQGHLAAAKAFATGGSEYDIHLAYRSACRITDDEMPYPAVVALNEHAATLHYQYLDKSPTKNLSLLIDAGCSVNGYASDITRSYSDDPVFGAMIAAMHELQQGFCSAAVPGADFPELHLSAAHGIANLLRETELINCTPDEAIETGIIQAFFPHGLGHYLGLQVHDVGSLQTDAKGHAASLPADAPYLRLARKLEPGNVLTIEPGLYFIDSLLNPLREQPAGLHIEWQNVAKLRQFGGIRIEDNLHITASGNENLTRTAFAQWQAA